MSKNNKKQETKRNDPVGEYLVSRIKELETTISLERSKMASLIEEKAELKKTCEKYARLKSLFRVEKGEFIKLIVLRDFDNNYCGIVVTEDNLRFNEYLDLLGEKE